MLKIEENAKIKVCWSDCTCGGSLAPGTSLDHPFTCADDLIWNANWSCVGLGGDNPTAKLREKLGKNSGSRSKVVLLEGKCLECLGERLKDQGRAVFQQSCSGLEVACNRDLRSVAKAVVALQMWRSWRLGRWQMV